TGENGKPSAVLVAGHGHLEKLLQRLQPKFEHPFRLALDPGNLLDDFPGQSLLGALYGSVFIAKPVSVLREFGQVLRHANPSLSSKKRAGREGPPPGRLRRRPPSSMELLDSLLQGLPGQRRALDAGRKLGDTLERLDIFEGKLLRVHLFPLHHLGKEAGQAQGLLDAQSLDRSRQQRGRVRRIASSTLHALPAPGLFDADAWLMEQPAPRNFASLILPSSTRS